MAGFCGITHPKPSHQFFEFRSVSEVIERATY